MSEEDRSDSGSDDFDDYGEELEDDEATLDEEEMLDSGEAYEDELRTLEDDANLSVEELRRRYYGASGVEEEDRSGDETQSTSAHDEPASRETSGEIPDVAVGSGGNKGETAGPSTKPEPAQNSHGYFSDVEDAEDDTDYVPPDPWRRDIREGPGYQAEVPEQASFSSPFTEQDRGSLLWSPVCKLAEEDVDHFLKEFYRLVFQSSDSSKSADLSRCNGFEEQHLIKDDENALKALMDADYDIEEALSRFPYVKVNPTRISAPAEPSKWTEEECQLFEEGLQLFGKNFTAVCRMKLPHRTVGELVHFYYIWKKTERHDIFVERTRLQERPNCTDFMGRLIGHMDATTGDVNVHLTDSIEFSTATNLEIMGTKAWGDCWQQQADGSPLPHLDNDTLANVLQ